MHIRSILGHASLPMPRQVFRVWLLTLAMVSFGLAGELPKFDSDEAIDLWLKRTSPFYELMVRDVEKRGTYRFRSSKEYPRGVVLHEDGQRFIALNDSLQGAERVSIVIFEMTNAFQELKHAEVDAGARTGRITSAAEFSLLHELIELDGLRLHLKALEQIDGAIGGVPKEMLQWINPELTTLASYAMPLAYEWVKAQEAGGHGPHYRAWFARQVEFGHPPGDR